MAMYIDEPPKTPELNVEGGSAFNWQDLSPDWYLSGDRKHILENQDRTFVEDIHKMLRRDGFARSVDQALTLPLRKASLTLQSPKKDTGQTAFIEKVLLHPCAEGGMLTPMSTIMGQMASAIGLRRTYFEKVYTRGEEGKITLKNLAWRPPASCELIRNPDTGYLEGFRQYRSWWKQKPSGSEESNFGQSVVIPRERAFVYLHGTHRDPMFGVSDLEAVYWAYEMKQKMLLLWTIFLETAALPKVLVYGSSPEAAKARAKQMAGLRSSGLLGMARDFNEDKIYDIVEASGKGGELFPAMIKFLEGEMACSVLAGFLTLSNSGAGTSKSGGGGSYALSADQSSMFLASRYAVAKEMSDSLSEWVVADLVRMNFGPKAPLPRVLIGEMTDQHARESMEVFTEMMSNRPEEIPVEFLDLLLEKAGQVLQLPDDKLHDAIEAQTQRRQEKEAQLKEQMKALGQPAAPADPTAKQRGEVSDVVNGVLSKVKEHRAGKRLDPNRANQRPAVRSVATTDKPNRS